MKLLITSTDAIYDKQKGGFFDGIIDTLEYFLSLSEEHEVVVISVHKQSLSKIPNSLKTLNLSQNKKLRMSPDLIKLISEKLEIVYEDFIVLGAKNSDMILAANAKILLLTADYAKSNNPNDSIYVDKYGIAIYDDKRLKYFFDHYLNIETPWFFFI
ncbi:hypothetical protein H7F37_03190 [Winogradskyella sp. PAMC22761]|nr:hypothetical protein H7F37_03190 [Winogradskyella sp. PAMC22761]